MYQKRRNNYSGYSKSTLKNNAEISRYLETLSNYQESLDNHEGDTVQISYNKITAAIENSLKTALPPSNKNCSAISERTRRLITRRKDLQKTKPKSREIKNELSALYKLISKYIRQDYKDHRRQTIERHLNTSGSLKRAYNALRSHKTWIEGLSESDRVTQNRKNILYIATKFYKSLYDAQEIDNGITLHLQKETNTTEINQ